MSGTLVLAILQDEMNKRGSFPLEQQQDIARVVKQRVDDIQAGKGDPVGPAKILAMPEAIASWYEREPGSNDE